MLRNLFPGLNLAGARISVAIGCRSRWPGTGAEYEDLFMSCPALLPGTALQLTRDCSAARYTCSARLCFFHAVVIRSNPHG